MPCCGKTTIGKLLSKKINYKLVDTDLAIQSKYNSSIQDIINSRGEEFFRSLERGILEEMILANTKNTVISTGGGLPIFNDNLNNLKRIGVTIFLNTPIEILLERAQNQDSRPLLKGNVEGRIRELYSRRINIYKQSDFEIYTGYLSPNEILRDILMKTGKM